jgi:ERF superfamily
MSSVHKKLMQARIKLQATPLKKSGLNKFAGFQYFELGDFLPQIQQIFSEIGLCGVVSFDTQLATLTITDTEDGSNIVLTSPMAEANLKGVHPIQNMGAVETYSRRYLWVTALEIVEHDALDATTGKKGDGPVITPKGDIGNDIPDDEKEFLSEMAASCEELVSQGKAKEAKNMVDEAALEADQKVWLWGQLTSTTRSAIKKAGN